MDDMTIFSLAEESETFASGLISKSIFLGNAGSRYVNASRTPPRITLEIKNRARTFRLHPNSSLEIAGVMNKTPIRAIIDQMNPRSRTLSATESRKKFVNRSAML